MTIENRNSAFFILQRYELSNGFPEALKVSNCGGLHPVRIGSQYRNISTAIPGALIKSGLRTHSGKTEILPVSIRGKGMSLDPGIPIATVRFTPIITDTRQTAITMTNLQLNGGDPEYKSCVLSAGDSGTAFTIQFTCGDSSLYNFLRDGSLIHITSISPNPSQDALSVELQSAAKQDATIEIFDALGVRVYTDIRTVASGASSLHLETKSLPSGVYILRLNGVSKSFIKAK